MSNLALFDGNKRVGSVALPLGQSFPEAVVRGDDVFIYFQPDRLSCGEPKLDLAPGERARFLKLGNVLRADR